VNGLGMDSKKLIETVQLIIYCLPSIEIIRIKIITPN